MNFIKAYKLAQKGVKVTHSDFRSKEFLLVKDGKCYRTRDEDGFFKELINVPALPKHHIGWRRVK